jgi:3,4-dihydroxy 2-butanone 4-phosphate synthase/GTP cyclohydrolase II
MLPAESLPVRLPTERGQFEMEFLETLEGDSTTGGDHISLIRHKDSPDSAEHPEGPLVRIHSECLTGDLFASSRCDCGKQLAESQRLIEEEGEGYLIYLRQEGRGIGLRAKTEAYRLQDKGLDTLEANLELGYEADSRSYKTAAAYLKNKGLNRIRLLTNNPDKIGQLEAEGLKVSRVPLLVEPGIHSRRYMETKKEKMGHLSA